MADSDTLPANVVIERLIAINASVGTRMRKHASKQNPVNPAMFTLAQAFSYLHEIGEPEAADVDVERALRAVGFLLQWAGDGGNDPIDGPVGYGLGALLQQVASRVAFMRERRQAVREGKLKE